VNVWLKFNIYFIACLFAVLFIFYFYFSFASPQQVDQFYSTQMYAMDLSQQYFMMPQAYMQQQESLGVMEKVFFAKLFLLNLIFICNYSRLFKFLFVFFFNSFYYFLTFYFK